ncbi:hypothetical protein ACJX0J_037012, partial [Zea mays]
MGKSTVDWTPLRLVGKNANAKEENKLGYFGKNDDGLVRFAGDEFSKASFDNWVSVRLELIKKSKKKKPQKERKKEKIRKERENKERTKENMLVS